MSPRIKAYTYLILVSLIWGIAAPVIKFTLRGIGPYPFLTYRFFIASVFALVFFVIFSKKLHILIKNLGGVIFYGFVTTTLALGLLFLGLNRTTVLDATLISSVSPLVVAIAGVIFFKENITNQEKLGISIAFLGTFVTVSEPLFRNGLANNINQLTGNLLIVGYLLANAFSSVWAKRLGRKGVDSFLLSNSSFIVGLLTLLPLSFFLLSVPDLIKEAVNLPLQYQAGVFYMALISGTIAYALWIRAHKTIEISEAGVFYYLTPLFAAPLGVFWLGEKITPPFITGALLIALGVIIAEYKRRSYNS